MRSEFSLFALLTGAAASIIDTAKSLARVEANLNSFNTRIDAIMLTTEDIVAKFATLQTTIAAEREQVADAVADIRVKLANIAAELAQGVEVKQADLAKLDAALDGVIVGVAEIYTPEAPPVPPVEPAPIGTVPVGQ